MALAGGSGFADAGRSVQFQCASLESGPAASAVLLGRVAAGRTGAAGCERGRREKLQGRGFACDDLQGFGHRVPVGLHRAGLQPAALARGPRFTQDQWQPAGGRELYQPGVGFQLGFRPGHARVHLAHHAAGRTRARGAFGTGGARNARVLSTRSTTSARRSGANAGACPCHPGACSPCVQAGNSQRRRAPDRQGRRHRQRAGSAGQVGQCLTRPDAAGHAAQQPGSLCSQQREPAAGRGRAVCTHPRPSAGTGPRRGAQDHLAAKPGL